MLLDASVRAGSVVLFGAAACSSSAIASGHHTDAPPSTGGAEGLGGSPPDGSGDVRESAGGSVGASDSGSPRNDGATPIASVMIPEITVDCPKWESGVISFMGLDGIRIEAGVSSGASRVPMLVYWHANGSTSDDFVNLAAPVAAGITDSGGVIVSFQGTTGGDLYSAVNVFGEGDLGLVDQLVACAVRDRRVDPRRVYTMGCSAGGFFATAMAALRSQYVAAAVAKSGGEVIDVPFANTHTPALMTIHPAAGTTEIIDLAQASAMADKAFRARDGFVVDCQVGPRYCDPSVDADAWAFLQAHPFGVFPEPWMGGLPSRFSSECSTAF